MKSCQADEESWVVMSKVITGVEFYIGVHKILPIVNWIMATVFIIVGIVTGRSKKPSGIYSNIKAPDMDKIKNLKDYNRAVGRLMIGFGILFVLEGFTALFMSDKSAGILMAATIFPGAIIMMIIYETVISPKYLSKKDEY